MSIVLKISPQGQITLPKTIREDLQLKKGDTVEIVRFKDHFGIFRNSSDTTGLHGMLSDCVKEPLTLQDMDTAIVKGAAKSL